MEDNLDRIPYNEALEKIGTVDIGKLSNGNNTKHDTTREEEWEDLVKGVDDKRLRVHGVEPGRRGEGVTRLIYENLNELNNRLSNNKKLDKAKEVIDNLEADLVAYNEHRLNLKHKEIKNGLSKMFTEGSRHS